MSAGIARTNPHLWVKSNGFEKGGILMNAGTIILIVVVVLVACCCFTHRRVIKAMINHEPMPKAPKWHSWVKPENRRK